MSDGGWECQCPVPSSGNSVCVCRGCHGAEWEVHVFSSITAFDLHRVKFQCRDPRAIRHRKTGVPLLELKTDRKYPYWGKPGPDEDAVSRTPARHWRAS